jgi:predicted phage terminase large subunit-like protein
MPPGSAKSTYASELFPPHYIGRHSGKCIITASYGQALSRRFGKRCRNHVGGGLFRRVFGFGIGRDSHAKDEWETEAGGEYVATSVDGAVTGRRADVILIDDPVKGRKEADSLTKRDATWQWYLSDVRSRLKPGGAIVLIMTRWHEDDLAGRIFPAEYRGQSGKVRARDGEEWEVICIRAEAEDDDPLGRKAGEWLWPEWFVPGMLAHEKIVQGPRNWNALYQQRPSPEEGNYFKKGWIRWYERAPARETLKIYGASDYAVTSNGGDYTVHLIVGVDPNDDIYVLDLWRGQTSSDVWVEQFIRLCKKWKPLQWAEESGQIEKGVGPFLEKRLLEEKCYVWRDAHPSVADKAVRAQSIRGRMAMGKVYFPKNAAIEAAPWCPGFVAELMAFDTGVNDDQVDAFGLIGRLLAKMVKGRKPVDDDVKGVRDMTMEQAWKKLGKRAAQRKREKDADK